MREQQRQIDLSPAAGLRVRLARTRGDVRRAQHLRHAVFVGEMGAHVPEAPPGLDRDRFDAFCDHLIVCEPTTERVVGTYRILPPAQRERAGGWYCGREFDVSGLEIFFGRTVEIGRACVAPEYRSGHAIALLWAGLLRYVLERGYQYMIGCVSIGTGDGGHIAASVCRALLQNHLAPPEWHVAPRRAFALEGWREVADPPMPPLLKGYLRLGAHACGAPAWDGDFNTADVLMVLSLSDIAPRYVHRLLRSA